MNSPEITTVDRTRFHSRVDSSGGMDACWPFAGAPNRDGYMRVRVAGHLTYAHRAAYRIAAGPIPVGMFVCHSCDNPPCVNPAHLWLGTNVENLHDMWQKGRGFAKPLLTAEQVALVAASPGGSRSMGRFAEWFSVSLRTIYRARKAEYLRVTRNQQDVAA